MMTLAGLKMRLSPEEALWAVTMGGAFAVRRSDRIGSLLPGYQADICLWEAEDLDFIPYAFGDAVPAAVFKCGRLAAGRGRTVETADAGRGKTGG
jgi:imidazolonepropionase